MTIAKPCPIISFAFATTTVDPTIFLETEFQAEEGVEICAIL